MVSPSDSTRAPATAPALASPPTRAPVKAPAPPKPAAKVRIFAKNDPYAPIPPPREQVPAPRQKILDPQAARSPALMTTSTHPGMPVPREIIHNYGAEKKGEELVEGESSSALTPSGLIVDPSAMSDEDQRLFQDILSRSAAQIEDGPTHTDDDAGGGAGSDVDMMGAGDLID